MARSPEPILKATVAALKLLQPGEGEDYFVNGSRFGRTRGNPLWIAVDPNDDPLAGVL